jgi:hypothetical protein
MDDIQPTQRQGLLESSSHKVAENQIAKNWHDERRGSQRNDPEKDSVEPLHLGL